MVKIHFQILLILSCPIDVSNHQEYILFTKQSAFALYLLNKGYYANCCNHWTEALNWIMSCHELNSLFKNWIRRHLIVLKCHELFKRPLGFKGKIRIKAFHLNGKFCVNIWMNCIAIKSEYLKCRLNFCDKQGNHLERFRDC